MPKVHWIENEAPDALEAYNRMRNIEFQPAHPHMHRKNVTEQAIHTRKNHLVAGMISVEKSFSREYLG